MTPKIKLYGKKIFEDGFVVEMKVWEMKKNKNFPDGIKYSLIGVYPQTKQRILMDNHHPKGHHYHINDREFPYHFQDFDHLINDFKNLIQIHLGVKI